MTGDNALNVFTHVAALLKRHPPLERNAFYIPAAKDTKKEGPVAPVRIEKATCLRKNTGAQ
ncbi:MAG: hypothetical protein WCF90_11235 [Methanomicrobiales archaeon]